jgi:hypothetical protein
MELLIVYLPRYAATYDDPIAAYVADGWKLHFFRPSRRVTATAPPLPMEQVIFPPPDLVTTQSPRYARRKCGPTRPLTPN